MPAQVYLLPSYGVMYASFTGYVKAAEAVSALEAYRQHPEFSAGQKHLIDFAGATDFAGDYTKLMELQAKLVDLIPRGEQAFFVYHAPTPTSRTMTQHARQAWHNSPKVVIRVMETEAAAMEVIGLPDLSFAELRAQTHRDAVITGAAET